MRSETYGTPGLPRGVLRVLVLLGVAVAAYIVLSLFAHSARADSGLGVPDPVASVKATADRATEVIPGRASVAPKPRTHRQKVHLPTRHRPEIPLPKIHQPKIHQPKIHQPKIQPPNIQPPKIQPPKIQPPAHRPTIKVVKI